MDKKSHHVTEFTVDTHQEMTAEELSQAVGTKIDFIVQLVEYELIDANGEARHEWRFDLIAFKRAKRAASFYHDLDVNMQGIALALDLLDKIDRLESELHVLKQVG